MDRSRIPVNELAQICAYSADAAEWAELLRRTAPLVALVAGRVARLWMSAAPPAMVDDIVQEVFVKLCEQERRILREFEPRGEDSFLGLLRVMATSVANDHFRRAHSTKRGGRVVTSTLNSESLPPVAGSDSSVIQKSVLYGQIDERMRSAPEIVSERDRNLFWLYYLHGLTAEEIAELPGIGLTCKGVESALRRVTRWLRGELGPRPPAGSADGASPAAGLNRARALEGKVGANPVNRV
jgi:RNA polymerase sigma-70 factor (ECF subfamily)